MLGIYLPFLSTERLQKRLDGAPGTSSPAESGAPLATVCREGQVLRIAQVDRAARRLGLRIGQTLAEAKAIAAELIVHDDDPAADRRELEALAVWCDSLSPAVHLADANTLLLDVTGCARLFHGEENLLRRAVEGMARLGFFARCAITDTPGASWAMAHTHRESAVVVEPGRTAAAISPLPVRALRIEPAIAEALSAVGVETIGALLYLPRSSLAARFGRGLLNRIDQALGEVPEPLTPYRPQPALAARIQWATPTAALDVLREAIRRTLEDLCGQLERRVAGVRRWYATFRCPEVITTEGTETRSITLPLSLSRPTRCASHAYRLFIVLLDGLHLPAPADALTLWVDELDPLDAEQRELFTGDAHDARELGELLDRLATRLGTDAVARPQLLSEHQPEQAFRYASVVNEKSAATSGVAAGPTTILALRPLRLLRRPLMIAVTSLAPDGPPITLRMSGTAHVVAYCSGPERIETGWWRGPHIRRDYYRVTTDAGRHCWIYRDRRRENGEACWYLHGWFD